MNGFYTHNHGYGFVYRYLVFIGTWALNNSVSTVDSGPPFSGTSFGVRQVPQSTSLQRLTKVLEG